MGRINTCGFETGDDSELNGSVSASFSTAYGHTGYGLRLYSTGASSAYALLAGLDTVGKVAALSEPTIYISLYFKYVSGVIGYITRTNAMYSLHYIPASTTLRLSPGFSSAIDFTVNLSDSAWHLIQCKINIGTSGEYEVRVDGAVLGSGTANFGTNNHAQAIFGYNSDVVAMDCYYDDIVIDNASFPGASVIARLDPDDPSQTFTNWSGTAGDVDDYNSGAGNDGDTTDLTTVEENYLVRASFENLALSYSSIPSVKGVAVCRDEDAANSYRIGMDDGTAVYLTAADNASANYETRCQLRETAPSGGAWSNINVGALGFGPEKIQTQARTLHCTALALMVEYVPLAGGPTALKTLEGLAKASVKTVQGLAIGSVKTMEGLA